MKKTQIYLAARYSRRLELCEYRRQLESIGFHVKARWLDGNHQLDASGVPISETGEALVENGGHGADELRQKFAQDDWDDVSSADVVVNFTEAPREGKGINRGGRHVECGIALANKARVIVVGFRENIFHWLPKVEFYETWNEAFAHILP